MNGGKHYTHHYTYTIPPQTHGAFDISFHNTHTYKTYVRVRFVQLNCTTLLTKITTSSLQSLMVCYNKYKKVMLVFSSRTYIHALKHDIKMYTSTIYFLPGYLCIEWTTLNKDCTRKRGIWEA